MKETSYPSPATQSEAPNVNKNWLVNRASAEDAPDDQVACYTGYVYTPHFAKRLWDMSSFVYVRDIIT